MKPYSPKDIADYYDQTEVHYRRGWQLTRSMALHYGYWEKGISKLSQALQRMNERLAEEAKISSDHRVLDAGCGVGGSCIYLARTRGCKVTGISLSRRQVDQARANAAKHHVAELLSFEVKDYTKTGFDASSFDVVWALESSGSATDKPGFANETFRVLKPGGRLIIGDWYRTRTNYTDKENNMLMKMLRGQAVSDICTMEEMKAMLQSAGYTNIRCTNIDRNIMRSSFYIFMGAVSMFFIANFYKLINPRVREFAHNHYKALFWQYPALRRGLWSYYLIYAEKH